MLKIVAASHLDHKVDGKILSFILNKFQDRNEFFIETFDLPEDFGTLPCALYGPAMGDLRIAETPAEVFYSARGDRLWVSRMVRRPMRETRTITVIAGPHESDTCVLYTVYGGPCAPQEPNDPQCRDRAASEKFWSDHALSEG